MEISGANGSWGLNAYMRSAATSAEGGQTGEKTSRNAAVPREDKVDLSRAALEIRQAQKSLESVPDSDPPKLARLQMQILNGTYRVDSMKTAASMIKESLLNGLA